MPIRFLMSATNIAPSAKLRAAISLARLPEHVPFTVPLTVIGGLLAADASGTAVDWRLGAALLANILAMAFAFMLNDVEDAPDDALRPDKRLHNVISAELLSRREGLALSGVIFVGSLLLFALCGMPALLMGGIMLVLCTLYSAHPFRFKARPLSDVISHALMLSGLLVATGYFTYHREPGDAWLVIAAAALFSAYGQFYNQVADFEVDSQAGLRTTAILLGRRPTALLGHASIAGAFLCMLAAIGARLFPVWLGAIGLVAIVTVLLFPWELDMRGNMASNGGNVQRPGLIVANVVALAWLAAELGWLPIA